MIAATEVRVWVITTNIYLNLLAAWLGFSEEQSCPKWIENKP